ncbi:unnamed protein product, partial [Prorocentrum cordatum]
VSKAGSRSALTAVVGSMGGEVPSMGPTAVLRARGAVLELHAHTLGEMLIRISGTIEADAERVQAMVEDMLEPVSVVDIDGTIEADSERVQAMVEDMLEPVGEVDYDGVGFDRDSEVEKVRTTLRLVEGALDEVDGTFEADSERVQAMVEDMLEPVGEVDNDGVGCDRASETEQGGTTLTAGSLDEVKDTIEADATRVQAMMEDMLEPVSGVDNGLDRDSETEEVGATPRLPTVPHAVEVAKQEGATESEAELGKQQRLGFVIKANKEVQVEGCSEVIYADAPGGLCDQIVQACAPFEPGSEEHEAALARVLEGFGLSVDDYRSTITAPGGKKRKNKKKEAFGTAFRDPFFHNGSAFRASNTSRVHVVTSTIARAPRAAAFQGGACSTAGEGQHRFGLKPTSGAFEKTASCSLHEVAGDAVHGGASIDPVTGAVKNQAMAAGLRAVRSEPWASMFSLQLPLSSFGQGRAARVGPDDMRGDFGAVGDECPLRDPCSRHRQAPDYAAP